MSDQNLDDTVRCAIEKSSSRLDLWVNILSGEEIRTVCEIGVWKGDFANNLLVNCSSISRYLFVDPWKNIKEWNKPANLSNVEFDKIRAKAFERNAQFADKIIELRMTTSDAMLKVANSSIDFAYVDGDHTLRGITLDLASILPKIRFNGFVGGDDLTRNIWQHGSMYDPSEVFPYVLYFAEAHKLTVYTLPYDQYLMHKNGRFSIVDLAGYLPYSASTVYRLNPFSNMLNHVPKYVVRMLKSKFPINRNGA